MAAVSPALTWEGSGEVPNFCPQGCGGLTEDPYGGPCRACWEAVSAKKAPRCALCCDHGVPLTRNCGSCEDVEGGYLDVISEDEPMWDCPHGIGVAPGQGSG
jgi:hypothetical protein